MTGTKDYNGAYTIADVDDSGVDIEKGKEGTIIFKVLDTEGKVVATKSVTLNL